MKVHRQHHQKQSLHPHTIKLALPALNQSSSSKQVKSQRSSSFASGALMDGFQRVLANTSQRVVEGRTVVKENLENEPQKRNDKVLILMRNELKEVLKNSSERKLSEEIRIQKKSSRSRSYSRLKEELTNQTFEKPSEPYLQGLTEDTVPIQSKRDLPNLLRSSEVPPVKRSIISYPKPKPVKVFQNEELHKQILENYYMKNTITEVDTDSESSVLSVLSPIEERLLGKSGSSQLHMRSLLPEQPRCVTEISESPEKQNAFCYQKPKGLYVLGNKSYQFVKILNKPARGLVETKKNRKIRTQVSVTCVGIQRVRAKSIPANLYSK